MDIRHIRYFRAVATHQNFSKAAQYLGISQPPLSMQIRHLEDEIGVELFYRSSHGAELTAAGQALLHATASIEEQLQQAITMAQRTANGELGELHLGFTGTAILNPLIPKAIKQFQKIYPEINLVLQEANSLLLIDALVKNELDIAIIRTPDEYPTQLCIQPLIYENLVAAVPSHFDNQQQPYIHLSQLKDEFFIVSPYEVSAGLHDVTLLACRQSGFEPKFGPSAPQIVSILSLVAANLGVSLVPESTQQVKIKGIQYCMLHPDTPKVSLGLAYQHDYHSQPAINFSSIIHSMLHEN
ncbi:LysR family transcriptional regulator [Acinetobacter apis]|uniref:DNA-binding transcriptional regulator, LysR family n=1 Tax=Acinetobacter apis TaxID=1229165 RepID=A0A217EDD1_9GAMM|nr:LysR family transcriptional regulator [Acinetobacter apis]SNQ28491.1 DNA-binding transcriptional regulator, LysR family [Acinetobacter apis]